MVALLLALAGCGDGDEQPMSLERTAWVLTEGVALPQGVAVTKPTAAFTATEIAGTTGCNRYGGGYVVEGGTIELSAIGQTSVACPAPTAAVEGAFVDALGQARTWELDGDELVLGAADGSELLRFEPVPTS